MVLQERGRQIIQRKPSYLGGIQTEEYAKEFFRLSKYAPLIVPTEFDRVERFRHGLIGPLYTALAVTEFPSLAKIIDKAKQVYARYKADRAFRE